MRSDLKTALQSKILEEPPHFSVGIYVVALAFTKKVVVAVVSADEKDFGEFARIDRVTIIFVTLKGRSALIFVAK